MGFIKRSSSAPDTGAPTEAQAPRETLESMYPASLEGERERAIDPAPATRQEPATKPPSQTFMDGESGGVQHNAIGLRAGGFEPSTHRKPVQQSVHKEAPPNFEPFAFAREKYGAKL